ncbi:MAG: restriction endonuclease subunit S [Sulfuritalea sp.]|nr:restriction endonuclease subunit S [Sulfuritalea sp.]
MSFPRYPNYKDSGVEWLGEVPEHWDVEPFKRQIDRNDGGVWGDDPDGANDTIVLRSTEQTVDGHWKLDDPAPRKLSESEIGGSLLAENDLLLTKSSGSSLHIGKTTLVTAEIAAMRCCYSNFMQRIRLKPTFLPKLAWHVMNNDLARLQFDLLSNSSTGLANLNATMVGQIVLPVPPIPEQTQIAAFLDRETAKIDDLVAEQRRLMELLKEKRQAVISHAVTQGLNPHAPMKPSGIEWLGDVPTHWAVKRLRFVAALNPSKSEVANLDRDTVVSFLPMAAIGEDGTLSLETEKAICELENGYTYFRDGDVTIAKITPCYENGKGALMRGLINGIGFGTTELIVARPKPEETIGTYLHYLFISRVFRGLGESHMYGAGGQKRVPDEFVRNFATAFPPLLEQTQIVMFLDAQLTKLDTLTAEAQRAIDLLQERRTALISAAVTGQIDVRSH